MTDNKPNNNKENRFPNLNSKTRKNIVLVLGILFIYLTFSTMNAKPEPKEVSLSTFLTQLEKGDVDKVLMNDDQHRVMVELKDKSLEQVGYPVTYGKELSALLAANKSIDFKGSINRPQSFITGFLGTFAPTILIIGFLLFLMRKGGGMGIANLSSKKSSPVEVPTTRFKDIAGVDECVDELKEVVALLKDPSKFTSTGAKLPRGYLLVGPPGTGKTMLARAVAGEAGVPFYSISGSDFVEIFVGAGAKRVREIFDKAKLNQQAIVFIDEIDAIGRSRGGSFGAANDERENTLNQLLVEMDGFATSGVIMIAATNRPDILDEALTRAGRFDRKIQVPVPDRGGREAIFKIHTQGKPLASNIDFAALAKRSPGLTGADIANLVNEAALEAARRGSSQLEEVDFAQALATTSLGRERKSAVVTDRDREIVAWHEAGHTICALLQKDTDDPVSVSIIPRGAAGGVTWLGGSEDQFMTKTQAFARLVVSMGGRAAEELLLNGDFTQGAHGDLQGATGLATVMVTKYGMGKKMVSVETEQMFPPNAAEINDEVAELITKALVEARKIVKSNKRLLVNIVEELQDKETLTHADILAIEKKLKVVKRKTS